jgi:hypothetical protein
VLTGWTPVTQALLPGHQWWARTPNGDREQGRPCPRSPFGVQGRHNWPDGRGLRRGTPCPRGLYGHPHSHLSQRLPRAPPELGTEEVGYPDSGEDPAPGAGQLAPRSRPESSPEPAQTLPDRHQPTTSPRDPAQAPPQPSFRCDGLLVACRRLALGRVAGRFGSGRSSFPSARQDCCRAFAGEASGQVG